MAARTARPGARADLGGFGAVFDPKAAGFKDPLLIASTDGVGTKLKLAIAMNLHTTVGIDLVAMCVNDLIVQGAEPLFFLDYFATGTLDVAAGRDIVAGIAEGCAMAGCALIGGETAEMPGMYARGDYDLAGFAVGAVERDRLITGAGVRPGDRIIGLASNGVHSNGFSLVRRIVEHSGADLSAAAPFGDGRPLGAVLLDPTRIYVRPLLSILGELPFGTIRALAHITGGGLVENVPRVLPQGMGAVLDATRWPIPPVFAWLADAGGVTPQEMARTFNCGIGMVVIVDPAAEAELCERLSGTGERPYRIGTIEATGTEPDCRVEGLAQALAAGSPSQETAGGRLS